MTDDSLHGGLPSGLSRRLNVLVSTYASDLREVTPPASGSFWRPSLSSTGEPVAISGELRHVSHRSYRPLRTAERYTLATLMALELPPQSRGGLAHRAEYRWYMRDRFPGSSTKVSMGAMGDASPADHRGTTRKFPRDDRERSNQPGCRACEGARPLPRMPSGGPCLPGWEIDKESVA